MSVPDPPPRTVSAGSSTGTVRFNGVQAMRFVAAALVVVTHATLYTHDRLDPSIGVWHFGEIGVDLFFTISGFVMYVSSARYLRAPTYWMTFGMRRIVRIVPMYWIATSLKVLTLIAVPAAVIHTELAPVRTVLSYLFLPSENSSGRIEPLLAVGWTLTFEMFFYVVFTLALRLRLNVERTTAIVMTVCALGALVKPGDAPAALVYLDPVVLYFVAGVFLGKAIVDRSVRTGAAGIGHVLAVWLFIAIVGEPHMNLLGFTREAGVVAVITTVAVLESRFGRRIPAPLVRAGDASYSLYLFHPLIAPAVPVALGVLGVTLVPLSVATTVVVAIAAGMVVYAMVEKPLTRYLQRSLPYTKNPTLPAA